MSKLIKVDVRHAESELEFELALYAKVANTFKFEILSVPMPDGTYLSEEEKAQVLEDCRRRGIVLVYRVNQGDKAIIFSSNSPFIGIESEVDPHGCFSC